MAVKPVSPAQGRDHRPLAALVLFTILAPLVSGGQDLLEKLGGKQDYRSRRVSSYDRSGGNADAVAIEPGRTAVLAEIKGPAAIHHIWVTIAAEAFYGRKIVLRIYWDGEESPSVEAPIGDFFGVGHGLNRNFASLPLTCSSEGRARNAYWYMPFRWSCRVTATNEGTRPVAAFYYYIDYRELENLSPDAPYFHAQYRQEFPSPLGKSYTLLEAAGAGHYVGCNLSVLQRTMGWWGEGDDMIYVDGEEAPSLHGTGSEDYFSDAWGMRESESLFYGCPLQEDDFQAGSKATVYRFHVPDPIPFKRSVQVAIEHGHANDRSDFYSSVAYWYQTEPHEPFPALPPADRRLPFALEAPAGFIAPEWTEAGAQGRSAFVDRAAGLRMEGPRLATSLTSYYDATGARFPLIRTDGATEGTEMAFRFPVDVRDRYSLDLYVLKTPVSGNFHILRARTGPDAGEPAYEILGTVEGYSRIGRIASVTIKDLLLEAGPNDFILRAAGKDDRAGGQDIGLVGYALTPSTRRFIGEWNLAGPFPAADMDDLLTVYPPEREIALDRTYKGKGDAEVGWRTVQADETGYVRLSSLVKPNEQVLVYALAYVLSPDDRVAPMLLGSDDGVRVWLNDELVHTNASYRAAAPDQDLIPTRLKKGWNKVLVKVLQGAGGWGYYLRFADPLGELRWSTKPEPLRRP